ncbi:MAG: nicotinate (nicotinamide) nucleotide adenylyltransferase [Balneolaceae bacterium]|nr:nicotinate (nicotinamide) nucleotide adenylyltransferase [Balneolaceae bacterium]
MKPRVGIFGGSFDPVHKGHVSISESFLNSGVIDKLLVLLTPAPPHKSNQNQAPYLHRLEMLKLAFGGMNHVQVSDIETSLPKPSYTLQTIEYLRKTFPGSLFYLCLGEDSLSHFHEWYKYRQILNSVSLIVARRPDFDSSSVDPEILERTIFTDHNPIDISSTQIRSGQISKKALPEKVSEYIRRHHLYTSD